MVSSMIDRLEQDLREAGFKGAVVSTDRLPALEEDLRSMLKCGELDLGFYSEIVSRYGLEWEFQRTERFPTARSIIIAAAPQPKILVSFRVPGGVHHGVIPPTYTHHTDSDISRIVSKCLALEGYRLDSALLPKKLLAVHAGLAHYGRNNITYIDGWGSYFRLAVFYSDMPCSPDLWHEFGMMEQCASCSACVRRCPTGAITGERFLFDGKRCLTFLNEGKAEFPGWVDARWHNCLVGCMICQDACPANKGVVGWSKPHTEFSEEETEELLSENREDGIRPETLEKMKQLPGFDDYPSFQRNLRLLLQR